MSDTLRIAELILLEHNESVGRRFARDVDVMAGVDRVHARALSRFERDQDRLQAEQDWREERA